LLLLLLVSQASTIAWLALFNRASPRLEPAPHAAPAAPIPVSFVVRSLVPSEPMLVGSETVTLRAGPSPDFPAVGKLDASTEVVAHARASSPGGASWIEIAAVNGTIGFVPESMVHPKPAPALAIELAAPPQQTPTPEIERAVAPTPARKIERDATPAPARKIERVAASTRTRKIKRELAPTPTQSRLKAVPAPAMIACILPGGEEIQTPRSDCRAQSGIIYQ
jgi:hypothetical protein